MLAAGLGATVAGDLGFSTAFAEQGAESVELGKYEALVELMRETPADKLQPILAAKLQAGDTNLKQLIAAGALANSVTFGGCDYVGFHTAMAMLPALEMSRQLPSERQPLPVLKVLYRNAEQIQNVGGASKKELYEIDAAEAEEHATGGKLDEKLRDACRATDVELGEQLLATVSDSPLEAFNALQLAVQDDLNVHRFVFANRTYGLVGLLGEEYSHAMLRQCVRFCINHEQNRISKKRPESPIRSLLPKLLDEHNLAGAKLGQRDLDDEAVDELSRVIYESSRPQAAEAVAAALAEGIDPEVVGEAISLASNRYVLCQGSKQWRTHGDSAGVHSSDATNAWRNMARVADPAYAISGLIVAAYHAGVQSPPFKTPAYPTEDQRALVKVTNANKLLTEAEDAIRNNNQGRASARNRYLWRARPCRRTGIQANAQICR